MEDTETVQRESQFTKELKIFNTVEMDEWLAAEAQRRLNLVRVGEVEKALEGIRPSAHGGNRNINKGMLIREALERLREQTKP